MTNSIISRFVSALKEYSFILNRDFGEIINVQPHKREIFINRGVKIFLERILEEMGIFHLNIQHYIDTKPTESFLDIIISMKVYRETFAEYIVFSPIKGHIFYTDRNNVYFNNRVITVPSRNKNLLKVHSSNPLFLSNLYLCYLLSGCFEEIILNTSDVEKNKYGLEIIKKNTHIKFEHHKETIRIFVVE